MRSNLKRLSIALLGCLIAVGLLASAADAAWYKAEKPGLTVLIRTEGHRIAVLNLRYREHCDDGSTQTVLAKRGNRPFNPRTGLFQWQEDANGNGVSNVEKGHGKVYRRRTVGRFFAKDYSTLGGNAVRCWTGRSLDQPGVSFVARRQ